MARRVALRREFVEGCAMTLTDRHGAAAIEVARLRIANPVEGSSKSFWRDVRFALRRIKPH